MIKSWHHQGLKLFYATGSTAEIQPQHATRLHSILQLLDFITKPKQMNFLGLEFHALKGELKNFYAVQVDANWQVIFACEDKDVILVDYIDTIETDYDP